MLEGTEYEPPFTGVPLCFPLGNVEYDELQ